MDNKIMFKKEIAKRISEMLKTDVPYNEIDHSHCWNQRVPACGLEKATHTVCCLCKKDRPRPNGQ